MFGASGDSLETKKKSVFHEQRICVKFCVKIGKPVTDTIEMFQVEIGEEAMCRTQTYEC